MAPYEAKVTSAAFNVMNFVLFDIILASLVFYLTADIAGLVNSASALQQLGNRLHAYNPPLVGVGLTCTRRGVFRVLALVRALAMLLVLSTNFLIEGASRDDVTEKLARVVVPGNISSDLNQVGIRQMTLRRRGCQGRTKDHVFYGELRTNGECELRRKYMRAKTVEFGLKFVNQTAKLINCKRSDLGHLLQYKCGNGVAACLIHPKKNQSDPREPSFAKEETCQGTVLAPGKRGKMETHLCEGKAMYPPGPGGTVRCRRAAGANELDTTWVQFIGGSVRTMRDGIDAVHAASEKEMLVVVVNPNKRSEISEVEWAWFYILGVKLGIILVLVIVDLVLRSKGFVRAANDEFGISSLLARSAAAAGNVVGSTESALPVHGPESPAVSGDSGREPTLVVQNEGGILRARAR